MTSRPLHQGGDDPYRARRKAFVDYLRGLHKDLTSDNPHLAAEARRVLARLRRSFAGPRQDTEAYDVVFPRHPPEGEQEVWVLVAGLFALHPESRGPRYPLGRAMGMVTDRRGDAAKRRFTQLLTVAPDSLPHYLRQAVQLLRADGIRLDYSRLLDDLAQLLGDYHRGDPTRREEIAHRVRLGWARDFYLQPPTTQRPTTPETAADASAATP